MSWGLLFYSDNIGDNLYKRLQDDTKRRMDEKQALTSESLEKVMDQIALEPNTSLAKRSTLYKKMLTRKRS